MEKGLQSFSIHKRNDRKRIFKITPDGCIAFNFSFLMTQIQKSFKLEMIKTLPRQKKHSCVLDPPALSISSSWIEDSLDQILYFQQGGFEENALYARNGILFYGNGLTSDRFNHLHSNTTCDFYEFCGHMCFL